MSKQKVLIDGLWRDADSVGFFHAFNPATGEWITYTAIAADLDRVLEKLVA